MITYDVIIVGGGPAGLTAAIFTSRRGLNTLVITKEFGGQVVTTPHVENYPGFKKIEGLELMKKMEEQAKGFGVPIYADGVNEVEEKNNKFLIRTDEGKEYETKTVILASGKSPRRLNVPGDDKFDEKGVSYCVNCDGPLYKDEVVCTVGGGNSALDAALLMSEIGKKVYLIHRRDEFRGFETFIEQLKKKKNVEFVLNSDVKEFKGDKMLKSVVVENVNTHEKREIEVVGAFVEIGSEVKTEFVKHLVKLQEQNHIVVNQKCETYYPNSDKMRPGIFAAGDVTDHPFKQIIIAAGQGAIAGLQAYNYIKGTEGQTYVDWGSLNKKEV